MTATTIVPAQTTTITYTATLESPLHHGAGSSGNTSILRTQEVVTADGSIARVPFVSAASIRHALRDRLAWHLADTIGLDAGSLSKGAVDLLWTGGAVTKTGAEYDLDLARRIEDVLPMLSMLGYAAQSDIVAGTLRVSDLILVCEENGTRLHTPSPLAGLRAAAYRSEEMGTRHDVASSPVGRLVEVADALVGPALKTTQMIWDVQVVKTGAQMQGEIALTAAATEAHKMVLGAALALWAPGGLAHIGAKTATGYGRCRIDGLGEHAADLAAWAEHVAVHSEAILAMLRELTA